MKPTNKIKLLKQAIKGEITKRSEHILEEYKNVFILTINEPDFPRKLLKYYNVVLDKDDEKLTVRDVCMLSNVVALKSV